jgi:hypothetical protein
MGMDNKHIGYLYLVDWNARIRWAACGYAAEPHAEQQPAVQEKGEGEEELQAPLPKKMQGEVHGLLTCIGVLLDRYKNSNGIA